MNAGPKLPGETRRTVKYRDPEDRIIDVDRADVRRRILVALAAGPLMKWEVRERLHLNETLIKAELKRMKADGLVKVVGKVLDKRAWALRTWQPPLAPSAPPYPNDDTAIRDKKPAPAADSWWTRPTLSRAQFQERARRRADG